MTRAIAVLCCCLAIGTTSLSASSKPAKAEESADDVRARDLYLKGDAAYAEGRYEDALESFKEAYALSKRPLLLFNIGNALERLGRLDDAADALEKYIPDAEEKERRVLEKRVDNLRRRAADQKQREAKERKERDEKAKADPSGEESESVRKKQTPASEEAVSSDDVSKPTLGYVLLGVGGAGLAAGGIFGVLALGARSDADAGCKDVSGSRLCNDSARDAVDRDKRFSLIADVSFGIGILAAGAGTYLLLSAPDSGEKKAGVSAGASVQPRGGELHLVGRF